MNNKEKNTTITSIIYTCDNNKDLSPFIKETYDKLSIIGDVLVLFETIKGEEFKDSNTLLVGSNVSFKEKMIKSIKCVKDNYVLIMLDDYYLTNDVKKHFDFYKSLLESNEIDYLKICKDYYSSSRSKKISKELRKYNPPARYDINFHPSIWKKDVLLSCLENSPEDIRYLESYFTKYMSSSDKAYTVRRMYLPYEELVVFGKFFRKPYRKYLKDRYVGDRKKCGFFFELKYKVRKSITMRCPQKLLTFAKKHIFKNKTFYSE